MTPTERSKFRDHCKAEAQRFDAQDTPAARAVRAEKERQARTLRCVRAAIIAVGLLFAYVAVQLLKELTA